MQELAPPPKGFRVPGGHFDLYAGGVAFENNINGNSTSSKQSWQSVRTVSPAWGVSILNYLIMVR